MAKKNQNEEAPARIIGGKTIIKKPVVIDVRDEDLKGRHERNTELTEEILQCQAEKSDYNRDKNKELKDLRKAQRDNLDAIEKRQETVDVDCYEELDEQRLEVLTKHMVGNKPAPDDPVLTEYTRAMTPEERQTRFGDEGENPTEAA